MDRRRFVEGLTALGAGRFGSDAASGLAADTFDVRDFGARGDGVADDASAILAAVAAAKGAFVRFPPGRYLIQRDLAFSETVNLTGVPARSVIVAGRGVRTALSLTTPTNSLGTTDPASVFGLTVDGGQSQGATGIVVGARGTSGRIRMSHVEVVSFRGAGATGLRVGNSVDSSFEYCYFGRNHTNLLIHGDSIDLPTLTRFRVCSFREAATAGIRISRGYMTDFSQCLIESNKGEGVLIRPGARSTVLRTAFGGCWFENNHHEARDQATRFHVFADGTQGTAELRISASYMSGMSRAIRFINVVNFVLDDVLVQPVPGTIVTEGENCSGSFVNMPLNWTGRLDKVWRNSAKHDMIVADGTRGVPPSSHRMRLDGWQFAASLGAQGVMDDRVTARGRLMTRRGRISRLAVQVATGAGAPTSLHVQVSRDAGATWRNVPGVTMNFRASPGFHVTDMADGAGALQEGDLVRCVLVKSTVAGAPLVMDASIELEIGSWTAASGGSSNG